MLVLFKMRCKTCKHWDSTESICSGITSSHKVVQLPSILDKKGNPQKRGRLLQIRSGISLTGIGVKVVTPEDFYCKNWSRK
jgi:hypothetical protein